MLTFGYVLDCCLMSLGCFLDVLRMLFGRCLGEFGMIYIYIYILDMIWMIVGCVWDCLPDSFGMLFGNYFLAVSLRIFLQLFLHIR